MPYDLEIHTIDVGQGDCCLICAIDTTGATVPRTLLIDGGEGMTAYEVDTYIGNLPLVTRVHGMLASNYDEDHLGGLETILLADNWWHVIDSVAQAVVGVALGAPRRESHLASYAAAAGAAMWGGWNLGAAAINQYAAAARAQIGGGEDDLDAVRIGVAVVRGNPPANRPRFLYSSKNMVGAVRNIAVAATDAVLQGQPIALQAAQLEAQDSPGLRTLVPANAWLRTEGHYSNATVYDVGDQKGGYSAPAGWDAAIRGRVPRNGNPFQVPGTARARVTPTIGRDILWRPGPPPVGAPQVFVVAGRQDYWQGNWQGGRFPGSGQQDNDQSIGVVVRHGGFFWWSGGDLPWQCENLLAPRLRGPQANGLPDPRNRPNGRLPVAQRVAGFKCGHHGAATATSAGFPAALRAQTAVVSCGNAPFEHPRQQVIDALHGVGGALGVGRRFYLTNCNVARTHVPFSDPTDPNFNNQRGAPGNKSRVSGDNNPWNTAPVRNRGNIVTRVSAAAAAQPAAQPPRPYTVEYFEQNPALGGAPTSLTDHHTF